MRFGDSSIAGESHFPSWQLVHVASLSRAWPAVLRVILRIRWGCLAGVAITVTVRLSVSGGEAGQAPWPQRGPSVSFTPASEGEAQGTQQGPCSCRAVHLRLPAVSLLSTWCLGENPYLCVAGVPHARETQSGAPRAGTFGATRLCSGPCVFCKLCLRPWAGASAQESLGEEELCLEHQAGGHLVCPLCLAALTPALWLRRHGCHTVIASRSFPRVSKVRGSFLCPSHPWVAVGAQSLCLEGPEAQKMATPNPASLPNTDLQYEWPPKGTPWFFTTSLLRRLSCWVVLWPQERSQLIRILRVVHMLHPPGRRLSPLPQLVSVAGTRSQLGLPLTHDQWPVA